MDPMIVALLTIAVPIILLGIALVALSNWVRGRNAEIKREGMASTAEADKALAGRDIVQFLRLTFFGDISAFEQKLGRLLAVGVIVFVAIFFVWLSAMLALRALR